MSRSGIGGPGASMSAGFAFGIPPVLKFGSPELHERFLPDFLTGRKRMCIAITEPEAGSDVANITTTATKTPDGKHYVVNGTKKWYVDIMEPIYQSFLYHIYICKIQIYKFTSILTSCKGSPTASGPTTQPWPSEPAVQEPRASLSSSSL